MLLFSALLVQLKCVPHDTCIPVATKRHISFSAAFVVFTLTITDFGAPKVIGGDYNVLATDIYKQVIGQQNFEMGAVVSLILLIPAAFAFTVDRIVQKKQVALLSARAVALEPKPSKTFDRLMLVYAVLVSVFILGIEYWYMMHMIFNW